MKSKMILWCLAVVCSIGCIGWLQAQMLGQVEQVTITEQVICGDPGLADGLSVRVRTHYKDTASWDTQFVVGQEENAYTVWERPYEYGSASVQSWLQMLWLYVEISSESLSQYQLSAKLTSTGISMPVEDIGYIRGGQVQRLSGAMELEQALSETMTEFFSNPVGRDGEYQNDPEQHGDDSVEDIWSDSWSNTHCQSVLTEKGIYFVESLAMQQYGFSKVPDGSGLYFLPLKEADGLCCFVLDEMRMVASLNTCVKLWSDTEGNTVVVGENTKEEPYFRLSIVDTHRREIIQRLGYGLNSEWGYQEEEKSPVIREVKIKNDIILIEFSNDRFLLYEKNVKGTYDFCFEGENIIFAKDGSEWSGARSSNLSFYERDMDYNGTYLAVAGFCDIDRYGTGHSCDMYLSVYSQDGLLYYGVYENSLDSGVHPLSWGYGCEPNTAKPLILNWE